MVLGYIEKNPIVTFKATYKDVDRVYLTFSELQKIERKQLKFSRLERARDLFVFQCYTGLAYSDMAQINHKNIFLGVDDKEWIFIRRKKTNVRCAIPLLPNAIVILKKYQSQNDLTLLPCYAIQKFNKYLQEIAKDCNINKNLTSHVGRRTFATTIALTNGVSIETVSKILGHSSTKITQQYAVVTDFKVSKEIARLQVALSNQKVNNPS